MLVKMLSDDSNPSSSHLPKQTYLQCYHTYVAKHVYMYVFPK